MDWSTRGNYSSLPDIDEQEKFIEALKGGAALVAHPDTLTEALTTTGPLQKLLHASEKVPNRFCEPGMLYAVNVEKFEFKLPSFSPIPEVKPEPKCAWPLSYGPCGYTESAHVGSGFHDGRGAPGRPFIHPPTSERGTELDTYVSEPKLPHPLRGGDAVKEKHGEHIYLEWNYRAPYEVVRGHVSDDEYRTVIDREGIDSDRKLGAPIHCFGRWAQDGAARSNGWDSTFYAYRNAGGGRFPVTLATYAGGGAGFRDDDPIPSDNKGVKG